MYKMIGKEKKKLMELLHRISGTGKFTQNPMQRKPLKIFLSSLLLGYLFKNLFNHSFIFTGGWEKVYPLSLFFHKQLISHNT